MKIAFYTQSLGNYISGGRMYSWYIAHCLANVGHEVSIFTNCMPVFNRDFKDFPGADKVTIYVDFWYGIKNPGNKKILKNFDLFCCTPTESIDYCVTMAKELKKKVVAFIFEPLNALAEAKSSNIEIPTNLDDRIWLDMTKQLHSCDAIVCNNKFMEDKTREWFPKYGGEIFHLWNGINSHIADAVSIKSPEERENAVLYLSRGEKYKGIGEVPYLLSDLENKPKIYMILGNYSKSNVFINGLLDVCKRLGLEIILKDKIRESEKFDIISKVKMLLFPSRFEGFGLPPAEALYLKTPVVCYDLPVLKEIYGDFPHYLSLADIEYGKSLVRELLGNEEKLFSRVDEARNFVSGFANVKNYSDRLADLILGFMGNKIEVKTETKVRVFYDGDVPNLKSQSYKSIILSKTERMTDIGLNITEDYVVLCRKGITLNSKAIENMVLIAKNTDADVIYGNYDIKDKQVMIPDFNLDLSLVKPGIIYGLLLFKKSILETIKSIEIPDNWELFFVEKFKDKKWVNCRLTLFRTDENVYENQDMNIQVNETHRRNGGDQRFSFERISKNNYQIRLSSFERPKTLVIIPAGSFNFLPKLYSSIEDNGLSNLELVVCHHVIEGNYNKELIDFCNERKIRVIKTSGQFNYCKINNFAFDIACRDHKYVILLNDDIILQGGTIDMILSAFKYRYDKIGIVGAKLIYESPEFPENWTVPKCEIQHAGVVLIRDYGCTHINRKALSNKISVNIPKIMDCVTFALVAIDVNCYESVRMDEDLPVEFNDMDFCLRAKTAGWKTLYFPPSLAMHLETATRKRLSLVGVEKDSKLFNQRYRDLFKDSMNYYEMRGLERLGM